MDNLFARSPWSRAMEAKRERMAYELDHLIAEGKTYREIGAELGCSARSVATRISRLRDEGFEITESHRPGRGSGIRHSDEECLAAIRLVEQVYGKATAEAYDDWAMAKAGKPDAIPALYTIQRRFGSWSVALEAARAEDRD